MKTEENEEQKPFRNSFASLVRTKDPLLGQIINAQKLNEEQKKQDSKKK